MTLCLTIRTVIIGRTQITKSTELVGNYISTLL